MLRQLIFGHSNRPELDINENVNQIKHGAFAKTYKILRDIGILVEKVCKYINCNRSTPRCSIATVQVSRKYSFGKKERKRWKFQDKSEVIQPVFPPENAPFIDRTCIEAIAECHIKTKKLKA